MEEESWPELYDWEKVMQQLGQLKFLVMGKETSEFILFLIDNLS